MWWVSARVVPKKFISPPRIWESTAEFCITASHNPEDYNGMKSVREESKLISGDTGLKDIKRIAAEKSFSPVSQPGSYRTEDTRQAYVKHLLTYIDASI